MGFADNYLEKHAFDNSKITTPPEKDLTFITVIPCFNEPSLLRCLGSLNNCKLPSTSMEIIIVINSGIDSHANIVRQNEITLREASEWIKNRQVSSFKYHILYYPDLPKKFAGAGLARKIGMDEAVRRFNMINNVNGVIISFDADSVCESNFITAIEDQFNKYPETNACSIYFEHPTEGSEFEEEVYKGIIQYELYLRYYNQALRYTTFPYAFHCVGSCFAVKAGIYVKQGGMNKKQAGEDFYFLQKIIPQGNFYEINTTKVFPSPRPSDRVPFGTGPMIRKWLDNSLSDIYTYDPKAFTGLKTFFEQTDKLYKIKQKEYSELINLFPGLLCSFLVKTDFWSDLDEINNNCSNIITFRKKFYNKFNAFKVLKYMNYTHDSFLNLIPVTDAARSLINIIKTKYEIKDRLVLKYESPKELLELYRAIERI